MNDADPFVREAATDAIGDQLRKYNCCCNPQIVAVLTTALGDCHRGVRKQAEQALRICGYDIVDGCCEESCCEKGDGCCHNGNGQGCVKNEVQQSVTPVKATAEQYFPAKLQNAPTSKDSLKSLFGMVN
jgi:hypothetical protein